MLCDDMPCQLLLRNNCPNIKNVLKLGNKKKNIVDKNCMMLTFFP